MNGFNVVASPGAIITMYDITGAKVLEKVLNIQLSEVEIDKVEVCVFDVNVDGVHKSFKVFVS